MPICVNGGTMGENPLMTNMTNGIPVNKYAIIDLALLNM